MNRKQQTLSERRLSLLESICQAANEIERIDQQITDSRRRDSYDE